MDHNRADGHATDSPSRDGPAGAPADQATMRPDPALVPRHVSANNPCSRSAVTVATRPNKATVTSPVNEPQAVRDPEERPAEIEQRRAGGDPHAEAAVAGSARREPARTGVSNAVERCRFAASGLGFGAAGDVVERALSDPTSISVRTSQALGVIEGTPDGPLPPLALTRPRPPHLPPA